MSSSAASPKITFDPGLTQQYTGPIRRSINRDGTFNVSRLQVDGYAGSIYLRLSTMSWTRFLLIVLTAYGVVNFIFAGIYVGLGPGSLHPADKDLQLSQFGQAFFFSVQTLTTVGYGSIYPYGLASHAVAAIEAGMGVMVFALATGLLFSRFSRPTARLVFSEQMVVAPYRDQTALEFRIANRRSNVLMEVHADLMLITVEQGPDGKLKRNFTVLPLERDSIYFLALTWTVVHPITESSPIWGKSREDLERLQAEVMILIKGYDDSFGQTVHTRYSYRWDEFQWSSKFLPAFDVSPEGEIVLDLDKMSSTTEANTVPGLG